MLHSGRIHNPKSPVSFHNTMQERGVSGCPETHMLHRKGAEIQAVGTLSVQASPPQPSCPCSSSVRLAQGVSLLA